MKSRFPPIAITGWGLTTPLGDSAPQTWTSLLDRNCIGDHAPAALPRVKGSDRVCQLAVHAAREALAMSRWNAADDPTLVIGTSKGPVETWLGDPPRATEEGFGLAGTANRVARELSLRAGPVISAACASGLYALIRGVMLLQSGQAQRVLVVAVESSLHPLFVGCFTRLGVLPKPGEICRPFDQNRTGFLLSEAAAAVCLEAAAGTDPIIVDRFSCGGAGGHLTSGDPDGAALRQLLDRVIDGQTPDLVHAHATGTAAHDSMELAALEETLAEGPPAIAYSHKGAIGHSLGAAGLVSVALNCIMHRQGQVPGNVNTIDPLRATKLIIPHLSTMRPIRHSVCIASGFGGPTAVVSLRSF